MPRAQFSEFRARAVIVKVAERERVILLRGSKSEMKAEWNEVRNSQRGEL